MFRLILQGLKDTMPRIQAMYLMSYATFKSPGWGDNMP